MSESISETEKWKQIAFVLFIGFIGIVIVAISVGITWGDETNKLKNENRELKSSTPINDPALYHVSISSSDGAFECWVKGRDNAVSILSYWSKQMLKDNDGAWMSIENTKPNR